MSGDFNAHFGYLDDDITQSRFFGPILHHSHTNDNGLNLSLVVETHKLKVPTTFLTRSTRVTWTNNSQQSQIDHIFVPDISTFKFQNLRACWSNISTDHKRLTWTIVLSPCYQEAFYHIFPKPSFYHSTNWDLSVLVNPDDSTFRDQYDAFIDESFKNVGEENLTWSTISAIACYCCEKLVRRKRNSSPELDKAFIDYKAALNTAMRRRLVDKNPSLVDHRYDYPPTPNVGDIHLLRLAHKKLQRVRHDKPRYALEKFLDVVESTTVSPGQKVLLAHQYLKAHRRSSNRICSSNITIKDWTEYLLNSQPNSAPLPLLVEDDNFPVAPAPTYIDMVGVVKNMRNNKTPGFDQICIEMFKASPRLLHAAFKVLQQVYYTNNVPEEWQQSYSVPIPKVRHPKTTNDYRNLTMSNVISKIYAVLIMERVKSYLPPIDYYQSGFLKNRSCDDLCFVLRNILDYRSNHGKATYVLSLDLRRAFDTIYISKLPSILEKYGVPKYLINRVINGILINNDCILWNSQRTVQVSKTVGIKQGCKVSPGFFILILDEAIQKAKEDLKRIHGIVLCTGAPDELLALPLVQSYADDLYIVGDDLISCKTIAESILENSKTYGLTVNPEKSGLLIKGDSSNSPATVQIYNQNIPIVGSLKVLGTTLNACSNRRKNLRPRVNTSMRTFRSLLSHLKSLKAPLDIHLRMYNSIIVPAMIYGQNCVSMTKVNEKTFMNREVYMIKEMANVSHPKPSQSKFSDILKFRTINRKISARRIRYYFHVRRSHESTLIRKSLTYTEHLRRRLGRPSYTFQDSLRRDFLKYAPIGITQEEMELEYDQRNTIYNLTSELFKHPILDDDPLPEDLNLY